MPFAAGVKFAEDAFSKYFNPSGIDLAEDDFCIVEDRDLGSERVGFVSCMEGRAQVQMGHLPRVVRRATESEVEEWRDDKLREREALDMARERAESHNLPIKVSMATVIRAQQKVLIHFTSEQRVDFRDMVKDIAGRFKMRIEMWQVGARKEAGMMDGIGICGNKLCCSNWMKDFPTISMRHAKDQDIIQPPSKLSGPCNKLRCCLRYEHEQYVAMSAGAPALGCSGCASGGACGVIVDRNLIKETVTLRGSEGGGYTTIPFAEFKLDESIAPVRRPTGRGEGRGTGRGDRSDGGRGKPGGADRREGRGDPRGADRHEGRGDRRGEARAETPDTPHGEARNEPRGNLTTEPRSSRRREEPNREGQNREEKGREGEGREEKRK